MWKLVDAEGVGTKFSYHVQIPVHGMLSVASATGIYIAAVP